MQANQSYKDSVFSKYFSEDHSRLVELYNALEGTSLPLDTEVQVTTLTDVLFKDRVNDISFMLGEQLVVLVEHQSTINLNMALRLLIYLGRVYEKIIPSSVMYKHKQVKIPTPKFIVLYNGEDNYPEHTQQKLSDAFIASDGEAQAELVVDVWNINLGNNNEILNESRSLSEYSRFVSCVRDAIKSRKYPLSEAVAYAVRKCIRDGVMEEFLSKNGSEVENMLSSEWNWETAFKIYGEESFEDGVKEGILKGKKEGVEEGILKGKKEGVKEGIVEGRLEAFCKMVKLGHLSLGEAIGLAGVSKPTFLESMHQHFPDYNPPI